MVLPHSYAPAQSLDSQIKTNDIVSLPPLSDEYTEDFLLGGRVFVRQPKTGYRVAIDPIFLAAAIPVESKDTVLDVGCGVGAAALCLAIRHPQVHVTALELQRENVRCAVDNVGLNDLRHRVEVLHGNFLKPPPRLAAGTFAHVMANPPYIEPHQGRPSPVVHKLTSTQEALHTSFEQWAKFCLLMVKPRGTVTFIHRADRLDQILHFFHGKLGDIVVYPLWPAVGRAAKRVLIHGIKNAHGVMRLMPGLVLHDHNGA